MFSLKHKNAVVFAASGEIATATARAFAMQGAHVFLSARRLAPIQKLAEEIRQQDGQAQAAIVDATNEAAINQYLDGLVQEAGPIDIVFNGIGLRAQDAAYGLPATELSYEQFLLPLKTILGSQFLTSRVVAQRMIQAQHPGTILLLTASLSRLKMGMMSGITAACTGIEGLTRSLAGELGPFGIRVLCMNPTAIQESRTIRETNAANAAQLGISPEALAENIMRSNLLGKSPSLNDIGQFAAFLASDAGSILNSHIVDADFGNTTVI
ncbi:MAG: SDR family oxidoreductase [Bacteroidota bacterium]